MKALILTECFLLGTLAVSVYFPGTAWWFRNCAICNKDVVDLR